LLLERLLDRCKTLGLLKAGGRQRTDSTHVLARVRATVRLECALEALRHALNSLAAAAPDWLRDHSPPTGATATAVVATSRGSPAPRPIVKLSPAKSARTVTRCWRRPTAPARRRGWPRYPPSRRCDWCGSSSLPSTSGG
jgi:hypothetical protein